MHSCSDNKKLTEEKSIEEFLPLLSKFIDPRYKIIKRINKIVEHFDDPKFFHFGAVLEPITNNSKEESLSNSVGGYSFFSEDEALLKCLGEALERHCLRVYDRKNLVIGSFNRLKSKAIDLKKIVSFSGLQKKQPSFEIFNFDDSTPFRWTGGVDLLANKNVLVPAQLVYLSYKLIPDKERWIYLPITTGAAGGSTAASAIVRGIYEIIERDAFIIFYLNKLPGRKIDLNCLTDTKVKFCIDLIKSYSFKLSIIDITTDLGIPTYLSIIIDETGVGPALQFGLRTNMNSNHAIMGSIQEALHPRSWIRKKVDDNPRLLKKIKRRHIMKLEDRALLWYSRENIKKINFFLKQKATSPKLQTENPSFPKQLNVLLNKLFSNNMQAYSVDVTQDKIREAGYYVFKTIIPQLHPFYLLEDFPYYGGTRLYTLPEKLGFTSRNTMEKSLNKYPHPFL